MLKINISFASSVQPRVFRASSDLSRSGVFRGEPSRVRLRKASIGLSLESNSTENPQQCTLDLKLKSKVKKGPGANAENSGVCSKPEVAPQLDIAATTALELKEKAELMEVNIEHSEESSKPESKPSTDMPTQMKIQKKKRMREEKKKETNPSESHAQHPQPQTCSNHAPAVREIIEKCPGPEGAESNDVKPHETPVQEFLYPAVALSIDPKISVQASRKDTATPIDQDQKVSKKNRKSNVAAASIEPTIQTGQDPQVDPATPVDPERMTKKSKKSVSALKNEGLESEKPNADLNAETAIERPIAKKSMGRHNAEPAAKSPVHRTEHLKVTESPSKQHGDSSLSCEACQKHGHRLDQCKRVRRLSRKEELEPSIDMPTQMKVQKKKRMREEKKKETNPSESHAQHPRPQTCSNHAPAVREIIEECPGPEGAESSDGKPPETSVQGFLYPAVALSIDPKIPDQASQKDTATPVDQDQKVSKKNRKSNVASASIEPTIQTGQDPQVDPATPVDPERMTKKSKKSVSALRGRHNAEPAAKSPVHRTEHLKVTESPSKQHGDSSLSCEVCQKHGHRLDQCKRVRRLSRKEELEPSINMPTQLKVQKKKRMREEKKKETNPSESLAQHPQPQTCSNHAPAVREIIEECPGPEGAESSDGKPPETSVQGFLYPAVALSIDPKIPDQASRKDTATPVDQDQKVSKKNMKSNVASTSIEPTIQTGQDPQVDLATPVDPERMTKKSKRSVSALQNEGLESEKRNADLNAETAIERPTAKKSMGRHNAEPAAKSPVHRTEHLKVTESPAKQHGDSSLSCEACQKHGHRLDQCKRLRGLPRKEELEPSIDMPTQMKVQKKKRMREEKKKETNPSESLAQHPQPQTCSNHAPAVREIIEECPGPEGAESSDGKPPETSVQGFLYPAVALSIDPKIPDQASRKDTATPVDQDQKVSKKNRKSNVASASIEPTIQTGQDPQVDPATPVDPERMTKKSKKSVSALQNEGLESEKRNADLNAETAIERPTAKKSMGRPNAEPAAKSPVRRTEHLKVTESPSKRHGDSSLSCEACQKHGHRLDQCKRVRRLSRKEEVCFFCGKIGHSLRKCGVTQAGGRFAKCLLCHEHGHFSYNCPQSENGKKRKELVANGAFSGSETRSTKCSLCHKRGHRSSNCPQNRHDPKVLAANEAISRTVETKGQPLPEV